MSNNWLRYYRLRIIRPKDKVYSNSITGVIGNAIEITDLRTQFRVRKTMLREPNFAEITIWNLNAETEKLITTEGSIVTLEAGYENNWGLIFKGNLIQPLRGKENGTDYFLKLICLGDDAFLNLGFVSGTLGPGIRRQLAQQVMRASNVQLDSFQVDNMSLGNMADGSITTTERHKVVFGKPSKVINNIAKMGNSSFYVDDGVGKFFNIAKTPKLGEAHLVNINTGMIGLPVQQGYSLKVNKLLDPSIRLDDFIKIDNSSVVVQQLAYGEVPYLLDRDGLYRVVAIDYEGDFRGNEWYSKLEALTQAGALPSMLGTGTGWMAL